MSEPHFRQRPWGYDRAQVDAFVERTASRLDAIRETALSDAAARETIDRVTEETNGVLQRAYEIAGEVTARAERDAQQLTLRSQEEAAQVTAQARAEAEALTARSQEEAAQRRREAEAEAAALLRDAEAQASTLDAEIESLTQERQRLLADVERISQRLHALVSQADRPPRAPDAVTDEVATARAVAAVPARPLGGQEPATAELPRAVAARERPNGRA